MRLALATILSTALLLSGCASLFAEPSGGMDHIEGMRSLAESKLDDPVFFGIVGVEGQIDIDAFLDMAKEEMEEEGEDPAILDKFEFRYQNGALGDGLVGSWFGAFGEMESERLLLVQSVAGGLRYHLFDWEEEEYESEAEPMGLAVLSLFDQLGMTKERASSQAAGCDESKPYTTHIPKGINSDRAARIAMDQPNFRNHTQANPDADFVYAYVPTQNYCWDGEAESYPAMWGVAHVDIDAFLESEDEPAFAYVVMNATDGAVIEDEEYVPLEFSMEIFNINVAGPVLFPPLGPAAKTTTPIDIAAGTIEMDLSVSNMDGDIDHWLTDPAGKRHDFEDWGSMFSLYVDYPAPGEWVLHSQFSHTPLEERNAQAWLWIISEQQADN